MDKLVIRGGNPLLGTVRISGAKNAALPCMAAALLTEEPVILENIPQVRDIETTRKLARRHGRGSRTGYGRAHHRTTIRARNLAAPEAPTSWSRPCAPPRWSWGRWLPAVAGSRFAARRLRHRRPSHRSAHQGSRAPGRQDQQEHGYVEATADRLQGAEIVFDKITVTGTEDLLMAATLGRGRNSDAELRPRT